MLLLSDRDLRKVLPMKECIAAMRHAFQELSSGEAVIPTRLNLDASSRGYVGLFMPAYSPELNRSSVKIVSVNSENPSQGRPLIQASLVLTDSTTGETLSTMNGDVLTNIRTAAGSGVATDLLSNPESTVLGIIGTGNLARTHLDAILSVRDIKRVVVRGRSIGNTKIFVDESRARYEIQIDVDKGDSLKECDIVCTVTNSDSPVLHFSDLKSGAHVNAVGTYKPRTRELSEDVILNAKLIVDEREACLSEPGDIMIPIQEGKMDANHIQAELGELLSGNFESSKRSSVLTVFKSVGNGIQDVYAADLAHRLALEKGIGIKIDMD